MIRAFIAVKPPPILRQGIETVRSTFDKHANAWRWVKPENVHLTLKFLGNVTAEAVDPIAQAMQHAVEGQRAFQLVMRSLGCFPSLARPRILWMGLEDSQHALAPLYQRLETSLRCQGFPPETRPFRPHLTLARTQQKIDRGTLKDLLQTYHNRRFGVINVEQIALLQSQLHREGAVYTIMRSVALQP